MSDHCKYSPSSAERYVNCPGSMILCKDIKKTGNKYTEEGRFAHLLAECIMTDKEAPDSEYYSADMLSYVLQYISYINKYALADDCELAFVEMKVSINCIKGWGTIDFCSLNGDTLHIIDLKYGTGVRVNPDRNQQLMLYAYGVLKLLYCIDYIKKVELHIAQPRINKNGRFKSWETTPEYIMHWCEKVVAPIVTDIENGEVFYSQGDWCWFCPGKSICPIQLEKDYAEVITND